MGPTIFKAEALTQKTIQMALDGDPVALRLCMNRIYPARKDRPAAFALPPITMARDAADLMAAVTKAVATGNITPGEATEIAKVIDCFVRAYQTAELDERVARVEQLSDADLMRIAMGSRQDKLKEVFEPFFTSKAEGMGMGLSIARTIIEAHHGLISANNRDNGGATFRIKLPLCNDAKGPTTPT